MAAYTVVLPCDGQTKVTLALFSDVTNIGELRHIIKEGRLEASLIRPQMILDKFQVLAAANRAYSRRLTNTMTTHGVFTEILYSLSANKKISASLARFGITDGDSSLLAVLLDDTDNSKFASLNDVVKGQLAPIDDLERLRDEVAIKKIYNIREEELKTTTLLNAVVNRIATKGLATF